MRKYFRKLKEKMETLGIEHVELQTRHVGRHPKLVCRHRGVVRKFPVPSTPRDADQTLLWLSAALRRWLREIEA